MSIAAKIREHIHGHADYDKDQLLREALAVLEVGPTNIPHGYVPVPVEPPFQKNYVVKGVRTENEKATTVYLYFSEEGGGWYQWGTRKDNARQFKTEKAALNAAKSCPGPWYHIPAKSSIECELVESPKAKNYRAMLAAAPAAPAAQVEERFPDGWAYRYADGVIRLSGGRDWNGMRPTESIPYYFGTPPTAPAVEVDEAAALAEFTEYFVSNYPGPETIISYPNWHAPRIFRAAKRALAAALKREGE